MTVRSSEAFARVGSFDLKLEHAPALPARIRLRQADGSTCQGGICPVAVTIVDNPGAAAAGIEITAVPPAASAVTSVESGQEPFSRWTGRFRVPGIGVTRQCVPRGAGFVGFVRGTDRPDGCRSIRPLSAGLARGCTY